MFLSHKRSEGKELIDPLYEYLKEAGLDPWKDDKNMGPGQQLTPEIKRGIMECSIFVCAKSPNYFNAPWCKKEFKQAIDHHGKKVIFPVVWKGDRNKLQYPEEYRDHKLADILYFEYDPNAINHNAEVARCANAITKQLSSRRDRSTRLHYRFSKSLLILLFCFLFVLFYNYLPISAPFYSLQKFLFFK